MEQRFGCRDERCVRAALTTVEWVVGPNNYEVHFCVLLFRRS